MAKKTTKTQNPVKKQKLGRRSSGKAQTKEIKELRSKLAYQEARVSETAKDVVDAWYYGVSKDRMNELTYRAKLAREKRDKLERQLGFKTKKTQIHKSKE